MYAHIKQRIVAPNEQKPLFTEYLHCRNGAFFERKRTFLEVFYRFRSILVQFSMIFDEFCWI